MKILSIKYYFTIKSKLILSIFVTIIVFLWLCFLVIGSVTKTNNLYQALQNIEQVNSYVFSLIATQKDFMNKKNLDYSLIFRKESYLLEKKIKELNLILNKYKITSQSLTSYTKLLNNYEKKFFTMVKLKKIIGINEEYGLHKELRSKIHILQAYAIKVKNKRLLSILYELRKDEKDFMFRLDLKYVNNFNKKIHVLLASKYLKRKENQKILLNYQDLFLELVNKEKEIGIRANLGLRKQINTSILKIKKQSMKMRSSLTKEITKEIKSIKNIIYSLFTFISLLSIVFIIFIGKAIVGPFYRLRSQYKEAIDDSALVSKTNLKGIITYVNDSFCNLSGYSRMELLGKNQNIIKHPDTSKEVFNDIWRCIKKDKKTWKGNIKNLAKDGSYYWVKTIINPIFNERNELVEYISIRTDITEHEDMKNYFKVLLNDETKEHIDTIQMAKEYRNALYQSNIISVFNLEYELTYVNQSYCKLTGYTKDELIGTKVNKKEGSHNNKQIFNKIFECLVSGKVWKGTIKNCNKNNIKYWIDVTYIPIKNEQNNIIEYIAIQHDITELYTLHKEVEDTQKEIIYKMGEVAESRSEETGQHVKRVAEYSKSLALLSGLDEKQANILLSASPMHDIGKVGIPDSILKKPGKLSTEEFEIMKTHAEIGFNILKGSKRKVLQAAAIVAYEHHEKWDGSGYPRGLKGKEIHIYARITAIADVFDALGSDRVYKKAWADEKIFTFLLEGKNMHFDPVLLNLFLENKSVFQRIRNYYND